MFWLLDSRDCWTHKNHSSHHLGSYSTQYSDIIILPFLYSFGRMDVSDWIHVFVGDAHLESMLPNVDIEELRLCVNTSPDIGTNPVHQSNSNVHEQTTILVGRWDNPQSRIVRFHETVEAKIRHRRLHRRYRYVAILQHRFHHRYRSVAPQGLSVSPKGPCSKSQHRVSRCTSDSPAGRWRGFLPKSDGSTALSLNRLR